jgi:hypothetical protein
MLRVVFGNTSDASDPRRAADNSLFRNHGLLKIGREVVEAAGPGAAPGLPEVGAGGALVFGTDVTPGDWLTGGDEVGGELGFGEGDDGGETVAVPPVGEPPGVDVTGIAVGRLPDGPDGGC